MGAEEKHVKPARAADALFKRDETLRHLVEEFGDQAIVLEDALFVMQMARKLTKLREALRAWAITKTPLLPSRLPVRSKEREIELTPPVRYARLDLAPEVEREFAKVLDYNSEVLALAEEGAKLAAEAEDLRRRTDKFREKVAALPASPRAFRQIREGLDTVAVLRMAAVLGSESPTRTDLGAISAAVEGGGAVHPLHVHAIAERLSKRVSGAKSPKVMAELEQLLKGQDPENLGET